MKGWVVTTTMANNCKGRKRKRKKSSTFVSGLFAEVYLRNQRIVIKNKAVNNLDTLLHDIYMRFIALREHDFKLYYKVFDTILKKLHTNMKNVDRYYDRYSSTVQVSGSHYDRVRIKRPDEFDVVFIIGMPLNIKANPDNPDDSDIILEDMSPGFVKLKMGTQFQRLPEWEINKTLFSWKDDGNYLLRSKFSYWFESVVNRGLDKFGEKRLVDVGGVSYSVGVSKSGPAFTLKITNESNGFKLDVDLVPALKFPEDRWPNWGNYRQPESPYSKEVFLVVPKPIKKMNVSETAASRSWRLSMIHQENQLIYGTNFLRQAIRFIKKLRDAQDMHHITSYCIKNLFLREVVERDPIFWRQAPSKLFIIMVKKFKEALEARNIPYFWNSTQDLLENVEDNILAGYAAKMKKLTQILDKPTDYKKVSAYLLTPNELEEYSIILPLQ